VKVREGGGIALSFRHQVSPLVSARHNLAYCINETAVARVSLTWLVRLPRHMEGECLFKRNLSVGHCLFMAWFDKYLFWMFLCIEHYNFVTLVYWTLCGVYWTT
jgi:hypothetical protein